VLSEKTLHIVNLNSNVNHQQLLSGPPATKGMRSGLVCLEPGQSCGRHSTNGNEEMLVFLEGTGHIFVGDHGCFEAAERQVAYIPPHTVHDVENTGDKPLVYIYCVAPSGRQRPEKVNRPKAEGP